MYFYQLMLAKDWQQLEDNYQLSNQQSGYYSPKPKRIKYFYDNQYHDIVKQLVNEPESCKNFYPVLQQVGLPYQTYYHKSADQVATVLTTALYEEKVILIHQPQINGYNDNSSLFGNEYRSIPVIKKEPYYEPDDSWLVVNLQNHHPEQIQILDASSNQLVTNAQTSTSEIFLKHGDVFSSTQVLPKVHILLGGLQGNYDLTLRGDKSLRVKSLAQSWLDELSKLLRSGNSPFTIEQDEALASQINYGFSPQHYYQTKQIDDKSAFRPDETIGVFFYQMLALLNKTDFITAKQRIGDCVADEGEGAIPDVKLLKQALKALHNIRHSEGQGKTDYAYHSNKLTLTANEYLSKPLVLDGTGHENDYESLLKQEVKYYTQLDQLSEIESLYFNAIKLLKQLREPGLIRHVETRREYQLKATKLDYQYIDNHQIRIDAQKLLNCAYKVCEKHLYHDDIKQAFISDVEHFASGIVDQVDSGATSYEEGSQKIKEAEKSLWEQSFEWITRGLAVLGGIGLSMAGVALCTTGVGCIVGGIMIAHGINSVYEGVTGNSGYLRETYKNAAKHLGMPESVGDLVYDAVDLGISIHGKLKLIPKMNEYGEPIKKLFYYGRQDLERAYKQINKYLLSIEIMSDLVGLYTITRDMQQAFVLDKDTNEVNMIITEPEKVSNVEDIIDNCSLVIRITGDLNQEQPNYYLCERMNGEKYKKYYDGHIEEGGLIK